MGIPIHRPVTADGRSARGRAGMGPRRPDLPERRLGHRHVGLGSAPIPFENVPPRDGPRQPRGPRADPDVRVQKAAFLFDEELVDVCDGGACPADPRD